MDCSLHRPPIKLRCSVTILPLPSTAAATRFLLRMDILVAMEDSLLPALDSTRYFFSYSNVDSMSYNSVGYTGDGPYRHRATRLLLGK